MHYGHVLQPGRKSGAPEAFRPHIIDPFRQQDLRSGTIPFGIDQPAQLLPTIIQNGGPPWLSLQALHTAKITNRAHNEKRIRMNGVSG